jgi:hypothetical protein
MPQYTIPCYVLIAEFYDRKGDAMADAASRTDKGAKA